MLIFVLQIENHNVKMCREGIHNMKCYECTFGMVQPGEPPNNGVSLCCQEPIWNNWGEWSECSKTCGPEDKIRTRDCNYGSDECEDEEDKECNGSDEETEDCGNPCCVGK